MFHPSSKDPYDLTGLIQAVHDTHLMSRTINSFIFARILLPYNNSISSTYGTFTRVSHMLGHKNVLQRKKSKVQYSHAGGIEEASVWEKIIYKLKVRFSY